MATNFPDQKTLLKGAVVLVAGGLLFSLVNKSEGGIGIGRTPKKPTEFRSEKLGVYTDNATGNIYGWIQGKGGEKRFVKMDKNSENKVRKEREDAKNQVKNNVKEEPTVIYVSKNENDVRSERIFTRNSKYKQFDVEARVKYRLREQKMLYRLSISTNPSEITNSETGKKEKPQCLNKYEEQTLLNLTKEKDNSVRFRFIDADEFWLKDELMPLSEGKANNYKTTVIDYYNTDQCGRINELVFHGRLDKFSLPDYSWVEDGKLIFKGVRIVESMPEEPENSRD